MAHRCHNSKLEYSTEKFLYHRRKAQCRVQTTNTNLILPLLETTYYSYIYYSVIVNNIIIQDILDTLNNLHYNILYYTYV